MWGGGSAEWGEGVVLSWGGGSDERGVVMSGG